VSVLWVAANWLMEIAEVRALKDRFQQGALSDDDVRAAADAVRARLEAVLGRAPAPVTPPQSTPVAGTAEAPAPSIERPDAVVSAPPAAVRLPSGVSLPGDGVTLPRVLHQVKPTYTPEALRANVEGTVVLQAVVRTHGEPSDISVVRSLDTRFGLDQQAVAALRQWRFAPGKRLGQPVPVLVQIEVTFSSR
jgi:protein TonB